MDLLVREATLADAELIASLTRKACADKPSYEPFGRHESTATVIEHLHYGGGFVLFVDDVPAGAVRWLPMDDNSNIWEIVRLDILPAYRGQDLCQHLLEAVVHHALAADVEELRVAVDSDQSRVVDLYAAYHFDVAMELEYSYADSSEPSPIVMRRQLR